MTGRPEGETGSSDAAEPVGRGAVAETVGGRLDALEADGRVRGYAPIVDHDALDARTVVVRLAVAPGDVSAVVQRLRVAGAHSVFELTGGENLLAICRFADDAARESFLAGLASDDRVRRIAADVALRTVVEGDSRGLL